MKKHFYLALYATTFTFIVLLFFTTIESLPSVRKQPTFNASAHSGDVFGPACGIPIIDGEVDESEWANAATQTFQMIVPGAGEPFTGTLKIMNGAYYLYYSFTVNDDEFTLQGQYLPKGDGVHIVFDNDHSGTLFEANDDVLDINAGSPQFEDSYIVGTPSPSSNEEDTLNGGTSDGDGAAQRINSYNHFEGKHPLCSGDGLDFCLHPGDTVGFRLEYLDAEGNGDFGSSQFFPGSSESSLADIVIGDCAALYPDLYLYLPLIKR